MRLAEALLHRKELATRIKEDIEALSTAVITPDGLGPDEDPHALLRQIHTAQDDLEALVIRINRTNNRALTSGGLILMEAIAHRDMLSKRVEHLKELTKAILGRNRRELWTDKAPIQTTHVSVESLRSKLNASSQELRELDLAIQAANWASELLP